MGPNEPAWPMCYLGALIAGATVAPVDPELPQDEIGRIVNKSKARLILHHEEYAPYFAQDVLNPDLKETLILLPLGEAFKSSPLNESDLSLRDRSQEVASLLFTSGTTGDPKGVMLTHANFCSLLSSLHGVFKVTHRDRFLSVLPLFHTFEFSGGFLMPASVGAQIMYVTEREGGILRSAMKSFKPTGIIGIPALWDVLEKRVETQVQEKGKAAEILFKSGLKLNRQLRKYGLNLGPQLFSEVHRNLGGKVRYLISGGAALNTDVLEIFEGLGFELLEGYGLTEAAPVLSVRRPKSTSGAGSVGRPLPGVKIKIHNPNQEGIGEVLAQSDSVMKGYLDHPEATAKTLQDGWLHTGDLGMIDHKGNLVLSGRSKEMIVTSSGKNVYPDELEPLFRNHQWIEDIAIVGIPDPQGDERVAALLVLTDDAPSEAQNEVKTHIQTLNALRPDHQRLRTFRFWPDDLPRTATRKVKRSEVRSELIRLLELGKAARRAESELSQSKSKTSTLHPAWLYGSIASLCGVSIKELSADTHLISDLGLSSLQLVEIRLIMEERCQRTLDGELISQANTILDLTQLITNEALARLNDEEQSEEEEDPFWYDLPEPVQTLGQKALDVARSTAYRSLFKIKVKGKEHIPHNQQVIVISNHSSHLDIGLIKEALGAYGDDICVLAAQDYFFDQEYKDALFSQFTRLIPVDRAAPLERSLFFAEEAIQNGSSILMYPEGTRSVDGSLQEFKAGVGYLQHKTQVPILPLFVKGTYKAMPKGKTLPKVGRTLSVRIGPLITCTAI
jgi:long-chain acyl-CoA synthetase